MDDQNVQTQGGQMTPATEPQPSSQPTDPVQQEPGQPNPAQPEGDPIPDALADAAGADGDTGDGKQPEGQEPEGAPEKYEAFKDFSGKEYTPEQVQDFANVAKELGLSQEKAQKMFGALVPTAYKYMRDDVMQKAQGWRKDAESDPEFGGAHFQENMGIAAKAYKTYASPELRKMINVSGLGNHPEFIRMFYRIGKAMSQDTGVQGGASAPAAPRRRFPNSNMVVDE